MSGKVAYYGSVSIPRVYCKSCSGYSLVVDGEKRCCGESISDVPTKVKRMSDCAPGKKKPKVSVQRALLIAQDYRCFYCNRQFNSTVYKHDKPIRLRVQWDHMSPYVYSLNNRSDNFVAACHVCNNLKRASVFSTVEQASTYLSAEWERKSYRDLISQ